MHTKLHAVAVATGCALSFFKTAGQVSGYPSAAALLEYPPRARRLLGDREHDADCFHYALQSKGFARAPRAGDHATS